MIKTRTYKGEVSNDTFVLDLKAPASLEGFISITFYSDEYETPVAPTAGTATFGMSEDGFNYGTITNGTITYPVDPYGRPSFYGFAAFAKVALSSIAGATHFKFRVHVQGGK